MRNRVKANLDLGNFTWRYIPTDKNPSKSLWPEQPKITETKEASCETLPAKKEKGKATDKRKQCVKTILRKHKYWKLLCVTAYMFRFIRHRRNKEKQTGPLTTDKIAAAENPWLKIAQQDEEEDDVGVWRCHGCDASYHPVFIPRRHPLAALIMEHCHKGTLHGEVQATTCKVRERLWVPQLYRMMKSVWFKCNRCKKIRAKPQLTPTTSAQPEHQTQYTNPFSTTGIDFAGPMYYKKQKNLTAKAYVILFTSACTCAVHLGLCRNLSMEEFKRSLREVVERRGSPKVMVSDNAKTFVAANKWLETLQQDEKVINYYVASQSIKWTFIYHVHPDGLGSSNG
ncbi:uncharacterized protein LOC114526746 [Dendronephthya gigantea]|uniref:uncharacterized protein LOC114526746 n=1 Tax=Dendronephthya gigantea TaxID=151771 RepID=UPI001069BF96|nr:uncharacterized protein LOC114526746 [Dendronephthya gigantea]